MHAAGCAQTADQPRSTEPVLRVYDRSGRPDTLRAMEVHSPFTWYPLPVVLFDGPGSGEIPEIYERLSGPEEVARYADTNTLYRESTLWKQYDILNVLGYRMRRAPKTHVTLRGVYSTGAGESADVARQRAESVQRYLRDVWGIDTARLPITDVEQMVPSLQDDRLAEEYYRVDLVTDDYLLFDPIDLMIGGFVVDLEAYDIRVETNAGRSVRSVALVVIDEEGEDLDSLVDEYLPNNNLARWEGVSDSLELTAPLPSDGFTIEARVRVWGSRPDARSKRLPILRDTSRVRVRQLPDDIDLGFTTMQHLPGFEPGDSVLTSLQKYWIRRAINRLVREKGYDPGSGLLVGATGSTALPELEAAQEWYDVSVFSSEHRALVELGRSRSRAVISYIRDTLGIPLLNAAWPENVITPSLGYPEEFRDGHLGRLRIHEARYIPFPEDRLYYRNTLLALMTPDDMKKAIEEARKLMMEYIEGHFERGEGEEVMELEMREEGE